MKLQDVIQQNLVKPLDFLGEDAELCRKIQSHFSSAGFWWHRNNMNARSRC